MKIAERIVMVLLFLCFVGGGAYIYFATQDKVQVIREDGESGKYQIPIATTTPEVDPKDWQSIYPVTVPLSIGSTSVLASVADTMSSRIKGLSDTPFLPNNVVKLFAFSSAGPQSIWMKDMNYSLDIIWISKEGKVVYMEEDVSPDTYPKESFSSPTPAWYVIEANAGFVASNNIKLGDQVVISTP